MRWGNFGAVLFLLATAPAWGQQKFSQTLGNASISPVSATDPLEVPFITWGGDVATFHANGGLTTESGSIYDDLGLKLKLVNGDDFVGQVRNYLAGKTPFLRGTFRMLGQASEVLGSRPETKPVIILQLSWSAGDHIVSRASIKTLNDLKPQGGQKVKIACQRGGPHVGLLYDSLRTAGLSHDDIEIVWVDDLTGPNGPAQAFRNDTSIGACCVITPDMLGLTGGIDSQGTGAEGTVDGARVLNSTQSMSRSIADVYAVRSDWYKANKPLVEKFVAGYLKATEQVVKQRNAFESSGQLQDSYRQLLSMAQDILGNDVLPTLEVDAHGLLLDCTFVGLPGQVKFFEAKGNLDGFEGKMTSALDMATSWGYASSRMGFDPPRFDYSSIAKTAGLEYKQVATSTQRFAEAEGFENFGNEELDDNTIVSFTIDFDVNDTSFSADRFGAEFTRAMQAASTFGNAVVVIRGHADPTKALAEFVKGGVQRRVLKVTGSRGSRKYWLQNGGKLDLNNTGQIVQLIESGQFETKDHQPRRVVQAALNLSKARADAVKESIVAFAAKQGVELDASQIKPVGAGISDPVVARPMNAEQAAANRRVEFRIVRVPAEAVTADDFDF